MQKTLIRFVTRVTWRVSLLKQELPTLPEHMSSLPVFSGVRVTRSLVLCVCFVDHCLTCFFFSWPLCCLFFDLQILITPVVSSNSSPRWEFWVHKISVTPTLLLMFLYQARKENGNVYVCRWYRFILCLSFFNIHVYVHSYFNICSKYDKILCKNVPKTLLILCSKNLRTRLLEYLNNMR